MGKKKIPTAAEVREFIEKEDAYLKDCIKNNKTFQITGPQFPGENIWRSKITLPLLDAAEAVGASNEEVWELCKKIAQTTHAPVTLKDYQRMLPFAQQEEIVNTVLKLLETYIPPFEEQYWIGKFDITGYYYCIALISLSDYRKEDCEKQLWDTIKQFLKYDTEKKNISVLLRNMKVLGSSRTSLNEMSEFMMNEMDKTPK